MEQNSVDPRPDYYLYWKQLEEHLTSTSNSIDAFFNGDLIYPRQFEIHLPGNHLSKCQLHCSHCGGKYFDHALDRWEIKGLSLLDKLEGKIPYHIYGGAYTEPLMNPYFLAYIAMTKKYGNHFGIHTNGVALKALIDNFGFAEELNRLATDETDYLSVSLDAGLPTSWGKTKGTKNIHWFEEILSSLEACLEARKKYKPTHAIRLCYLISKHSGTTEDFASIVNWAKDHQVDSLRFSIPFGNYNQSFEKIRQYKESIEIPLGTKYREMLAPYLSLSQNDKPYIFYTGPEFTDVDRFNFKQCIYGYYQITYGADGYAYKCSTVSTPTGKQCRLGKITDDVEEFNKIVLSNYNPNFDCEKMCFSKGLRCNRQGLEINTTYKRLQNG